MHLESAGVNGVGGGGGQQPAQSKSVLSHGGEGEQTVLEERKPANLPARGPTCAGIAEARQHGRKRKSRRRNSQAPGLDQQRTVVACDQFQFPTWLKRT